MARHARLAPALLRMSVELLARNAAAYRVEHRMAAISFGSSVNVDVPLTAVGGTERARIIERIESLSGESRGETDVLAALAAAERLFRTLPADASRRRAIVLVTDGMPYVRGTDMDRYMSALRRYVTTHLPASTVSIDVLLLSPQGTSAAPDALWRSLTAGVHRVDDSPANVLATAHAVVTQLAGTASAESAPSKTASGIDFLIVPPYLETIVFDLLRDTADTAVDVYPPGSATPLRDGVDGVEVVRMGDVLATLAVARPRPGQWLVRKSRGGAQVRVRSQQFFPRGVLLQPGPASTTTPRDRVRIAYQVLDGTQQPIDELRQYPLSLRATIATPDGRKLAVPMERDAGRGSATFQATEEAHCTMAGRYWTDVRVSTIDAGGRPLDVFRDRWSGFTVSPSQAPIQSSMLTRAPPPAAAGPPSMLWAIGVGALLLLLIGAVVRRRKLRAASSCLSSHPEQDKR